MPPAEEVREWIEWDRANPSPYGDHLAVSEVGSLDLPWAEAASEHFSKDSTDREQTRDAFARELVRDTADVNPRFVALHFYWLAREEIEIAYRSGPGWAPPGEARELDQVRQEFRQELTPLVALLRVEDCPANWKFIEWEILNSCLVGHIERILQLLTRAENEKLLERSLAQAFRAQYRFVAALEGTAELESQDWRPRLYRFPKEQDYKAILTGLRLFLLGLVPGDSSLGTHQCQIEALRDVAHDLEKAVAAVQDIPLSYRSALARSYFGLGRFRDAADQYDRLLGADLKLGENLDLRKVVYDSLVHAHEKAGDLAAAIRALGAEIAEYGQEKGLWKRMAYLKATEAQYFEVAECLRREAENDPGVDKDPMLNTILALGAIQGLPEGFRRSFPQLWEGVHWGLERFWETFGKLHAEAAKICAEAELSAALSKHSEYSPEQLLRDAASKWALGVEVEFREGLFRGFSHFVGRTDNLRPVVERGAAKGSKTEFFSNFLLGRGRLTLGQMHRVLCECKPAAPGGGLFYEFREWLTRERPRFNVRESINALQKINDFRNPVTHREGALGSPEEAIRLCRSLLEAITSAY